MNSNWSYSPETPNLGQICRFLEPCDLEIWWMTLKNNRAPLLSNIKLYASFHHHMRIQTGVTVWKRSSWVVTSVTLTFNLWPWPFAWTLLLSLSGVPDYFYRTTFIATRFRVAVICPIIPVPHCIRVFFYFVWFVFINHIFQFYYELCTYCNILDIYLS